MSTKQTFKIIDGVYEGPKHWKGFLDLRGYKDILTSLGNLETVEGWLDLEGCSNLKTLGDLKEVGGGLYLIGCIKLNTLGNLKAVDGSLFLRGCSNLITLGNLEKVNSKISLNEYKKVPLSEVQEKSKYYSALPAHEALNTITSQEVQETPLYRNVLTGVLQG
jgi:hypothetical protein